MNPVVLVDRREQKPWSFSSALFGTQPATLATGDYSILGLEDRVAIERKSLGDLVGTVIRDWMRFRKELYRLAAFDFAAIIVEADVKDLWEGRFESEANPASVWGRCNDCMITHGVPVLWWGQRKYCEPAVGRLLLSLARKYGLEEYHAA